MHIYYVTTNKQYEDFIDKEHLHSYRQFLHLKKLYSNKKNIFNVIVLERNNPYSYYFFYKSIWGRDDIIIIEHDIYVSDKEFVKMIKCKERLCSARYKIAKIPSIKHQNKIKKTILLKNNIELTKKELLYYTIPICNRNKDNLIYYDMGIPMTPNNSYDSKFCDYGCFGFCKISKEVQKAVEMNIPHKWESLDSDFYKKYVKVYGLKQVHQHDFVAHLHRY